jgi:hypothetical protein
MSWKVETRAAMDKEAVDLASVAYIEKGANVNIDEVFDLIKIDVHDPSTRPCETCRKVTALVHAPFWCLRFALKKKLEKNASGE